MPSVEPPSVLYAHYGFRSGPRRFGTRPFNFMLDNALGIMAVLYVYGFRRGMQNLQHTLGVDRTDRRNGDCLVIYSIAPHAFLTWRSS